MRRGSRATLVALGAFLTLGVVNNIAASLFAARFGVGLLDLDGMSSVVSMQAPAGLPAPGTDRVQAILDLYSSGAAGAHIALTLTLDLLFPVAGVLFGWIASRNLRAVLGAPAVVAIIGIVLAIGYGFRELAENFLEVLLLAGASDPWIAASVAGMHVIKNAFAAPLLAYIAVGYLVVAARALARRRRVAQPA